MILSQHPKISQRPRRTAPSKSREENLDAEYQKEQVKLLHAGALFEEQVTGKCYGAPVPAGYWQH